MSSSPGPARVGIRRAEMGVAQKMLGNARVRSPCDVLGVSVAKVVPRHMLGDPSVCRDARHERNQRLWR